MEKIFRKLKTRNLYIWLKAKDIAVAVLLVYLIFQFVRKFPILFILLGLILMECLGNNYCGIWPPNGNTHV